jgi:hypothetical protein
LQKEAEKQLARLAATAGDINDNIRRLGEIVGTQLQASVEKAVSAFHSRIGQVCQEMVGRAAKRLTETAQNSTVELANKHRNWLNGKCRSFSTMPFGDSTARQVDLHDSGQFSSQD